MACISDWAEEEKKIKKFRHNIPRHVYRPSQYRTDVLVNRSNASHRKSSSRRVSLVSILLWHYTYLQYLSTRSTQAYRNVGFQVLYSGFLWPHPARVTRLHHRRGAIEAEIFIFKVCPGPGLKHGPRSLMAANVTTRLRRIYIYIYTYIYIHNIGLYIKHGVLQARHEICICRLGDWGIGLYIYYVQRLYVI